MASVVEDLDFVSELKSLFIYARDYKRSRYEAWQRNYRLVNNKIGGQATTAWMPSPRDSEIYPVLSSLVAWMTDQGNAVEMLPRVDPTQPMYELANTLAQDLEDCIMAAWENGNFDAQKKLWLWDTFQYGFGIPKNIWDNALDDGYGNCLMRRVDPWSFYWDPTANNMDEAGYFVEAHIMTLDEIERRYGPQSRRLFEMGGGGEKLDEKPQLFANLTGQPMANVGFNMPSAGTFPGSSPAVQARYGRPMRYMRHGITTRTFTVYEFWLRENYEWEDYETEQSSDYKGANHVDSEWRVVVMANGVILMDEMARSLWSHGSHPYERFVFDDIGDFTGIALVDHLAYPQIYINRLLTALQYNAELTGNPILLEPAVGSTSRVNMINRPGQRIPVQGVGGMANNAPKWLEPPQMPQQVMELVQFWLGRMENISGLSALQKGAAPNQRNAENVINAVQEAAFVRIRSGLANLEMTLRGCVWKLANLIVENYDQERIIAVTGQDGGEMPRVIRNDHFFIPSATAEDPRGVPLKFAMSVHAGANSPTSSQARIAQAERLFALGAVDDRYILQAHRVRRIDDILRRLYMKRQLGVMASPGARQRAGRAA